MAWLVLLASAVLEAVWATALGQSDGFTRPVETTVFVVAAIASVVGLGRAMRSIPTGTAYTVWTGVGSVLTVTYAVLTGNESMTWLKALFLVGIIGCAIGLKVVSSRDPDAAPRRSAGDVQAG